MPQAAAVIYFYRALARSAKPQNRDLQTKEEAQLRLELFLIQAGLFLIEANRYTFFALDCFRLAESPLLDYIPSLLSFIIFIGWPGLTLIASLLANKATQPFSLIVFVCPYLSGLNQLARIKDC